MGKAEGRRWTVLAVAFIATVAAIFADPHEGAGIGNGQKDHRVPSNVSAPDVSVAAGVFVEAADADPFATRGWDEPPPPTPPEPTVVTPIVAAIPVVPSLAPALPPLPFRYVGQFSDDSKAVLYLARGDTALLVHVGEVLDNAYKVTAIDTKSVEFEYLATGSKQTLSIPERE